MKNVLILVLLAVLISCNKSTSNFPKKEEVIKKAETENTVPAEKEKKEEPEITEKGGELTITFKSETEEEEIYVISAVERKSKESNSYVKKEMESRLNEDEKFYLLTVKIKNGGENPLVNIKPSHLQVETEEGVLYKNTTDYLATGEVGSMKDSYEIEVIPAGTSREVKLNYRIKGEPKYLDFIADNRIIGKLLLK